MSKYKLTYNYDNSGKLHTNEFGSKSTMDTFIEVGREQKLTVVQIEELEDNTRVYGYARVSTKEQNLDRQLIELKKYVSDRFIFQDKQSGKDFDRKEYQLMRKVAQKGDVIYIKSLDRLGRNKSQIKQELEHYKNEGVRVKVLDIPTTMMDIPEGQEWLMDMINNLLIEVLSTMAEQERNNIKLRQAEGIAAAKLKGKKLGRPEVEFPSNWVEIYKQWKVGEITAVKAMELTGLKKNSFYNLVKRYEDK